MTKVKNSRKGIWGTAVVGGTALAIALSGTAFGVSAHAQPVAHTTTTSAPKPTVVLVHGAFADASGWNGVIQRLQSRGYKVVAPANPLRGLASDSAYIKSFLKTIDGPIVLAGHSYGGAVISEAAADNPNVKALVYVAAFMPDENESLTSLSNGYGSELNDALNPQPYETSAGSGTDLYIKQDKFHAVFAADLPCDQANAMFAGQRPIDSGSFNEKATKVAWHTVPSWAVVAKQDKAIDPNLERYEAQRAGSHTVEINSSHVAMTSHPDVVADVVMEAARSVR